MTQPSLKKAWTDEETKLVARHAEMHKEPNNNMSQCRHNAAILVEHITKAFDAAGYMPIRILLGAVVTPVIESGQQCGTCEQDADDEYADDEVPTLPRSYEFYADGDDYIVVDVSRDLAFPHIRGQNGCTGPHGDCQLFYGQYVGKRAPSGPVMTTYTAGYLRQYARAIDADLFVQFDADLFDATQDEQDDSPTRGGAD